MKVLQSLVLVLAVWAAGLAERQGRGPMVALSHHYF